MASLSAAQITATYFKTIGGFPSLEIIHALSEYDGCGQACIGCTQLPGEEASLVISGIKTYSQQEKKRILREWIDFLSTNTKEFKALHFNTRVPQALFDAACCQENLEELRFKWGPYSNLSALSNLSRLKYLYIGQGVSVQNIAVLGQLKKLVVLHVNVFKKIEDYSPTAALKNLEQLVIEGPLYGVTPVKDLEFLREMQNLRSILLCAVKVIKKYTRQELAELRAAVPDLHDIRNCLF